MLFEGMLQVRFWEDYMYMEAVPSADRVAARFQNE